MSDTAPSTASAGVIEIATAPEPAPLVPLVPLGRAAAPAPDTTASDKVIPKSRWDRLDDQRDRMIDAMVRIFTWLNGGVYLLVFLAWLVGIWLPDYRIVDSKMIMTLIGATVVQAGIAFVGITRYLFPNAENDKPG